MIHGCRWIAVFLIMVGASSVAFAQGEPTAPLPPPTEPPAPVEPVAPIEVAPSPVVTVAPSPSEAAAPAAEAPRPLVGARTSLYVSAGVSETPQWVLGMSFAPGISLAVGVQANYDGNGLPTGNPMMPRSEEKLSLRALVYGAYYFYNLFPVAIGGELAVATGFKPTFNDVLTVQPGLVAYYAPFKVPVVIGTALNLQMNFPDGGEPIIKTLMPGLRLIYVIR